VSTVLCPVATSSGEALEERVGSPGEHAELGDTLVWFALALLILSALLVYLQRRNDAPGAAPAGRAIQVVAALAVIAALASTVQVYRVGDSGAKAVWGDSASASSGD
jgi:hypothetical protein